MTVVDWIDVFIRKSYRDTIIEALRYNILNKGLNIYAYCIMSNHIHLVVNANEPYQLKDIIRDFKKFTSKKIISQIKAKTESRQEWMLKIFKESKTNKHSGYKFWQAGNHAIELFSEKFTWEKVNYIHQNPVKAGMVAKPEDWMYSSAGNYADSENLVLNEIVYLTPRLITVS